MKIGRRKIFSIGLITTLTMLSNSSAQAHGGRTNSQGCHNNRKTGGYHCHNSPARKPSQTTSRRLGALSNPTKPNIDRSKITTAQTALKALGYDIKVIDGNAGRKTKKAMRAFEVDHKLLELGMVTDERILNLVEALASKAKC